MIKALKSLLLKCIPAENLQNPDESRSQALNFVFIGFTSSLVLLAFIISYFLKQQYWVCEINILAFFVVTPSWLFFKKIKSIRIAGNLFMFGAFISLVVGSWFAGGINAPGILWFSVAQLGAIFILRSRGVYLWTILFSVAALVLTFAPRFAIQLPVLLSTDDSDFIKLLSTIGTGLVTLVLSQVYFAEKHARLKQVEAKRIESEAALMKMKEADSKLFDKLMENASLARVLSHDVSNPLMVISYMVKLMEKKDDGRHAEAILRIKKSVQNATDIITQVRALQAMNSGKMQLELVAVPLVDVIEECLINFRERLEEKKLKAVVKNNLTDEKDMNILAERVSLSQSVVNNLISNAIKFSEIGGSIELVISKHDQRVQLTVKDHGIGMPQELIKKIFRADQATSRNGTAGEKGTGFGMPLVKSYLDQYGAEIRVSSQTPDQNPMDHGTQFDIDFKIAG